MRAVERGLLNLRSESDDRIGGTYAGCFSQNGIRVGDTQFTGRAKRKEEE